MPVAVHDAIMNSSSDGRDYELAFSQFRWHNGTFI
jgi:hypothetical protein